jgi:hypothetical protein
VDKPANSVPDLGVSSAAAASEAELDAFWSSHWVAVRIKSADGEVPIVEVHAYHWPGDAYLSFLQFRAGGKCLGLDDPARG